VLVQNKYEFVELFMRRVDMNEFLSEKRLNELYKKVCKLTMETAMCTLVTCSKLFIVKHRK